MKMAIRVRDGANWLAFPRPEVPRSTGELGELSQQMRYFERLGVMPVCSHDPRLR
jgi:hypothetical protein